MVATYSNELSSCLSFSSEERLLILCTRLELTLDQRQELDTLLAGRLNWDRVLYKSQWHKLSGLLYRHCRDQDNRDRVPAGVMFQLKVMYLANVAKNLCFQSEFRRILEALKAQAIPVIACSWCTNKSRSTMGRSPTSP